MSLSVYILLLLGVILFLICTFYSCFAYQGVAIIVYVKGSQLFHFFSKEGPLCFIISSF
jgi:hypothetical protein